MKFDDDRVDASQLEDRRGTGRGAGGMGRGGMMGAGAGGLGVVALLVLLLLGVNPLESDFTGTATGTQPAPASDVATRCNTPGAVDRYQDCFIVKIFNENNEIWTDQVQGYQRPTLVFFERGVRTGCGPASSQTGPFYCPADSKVYVDLGFMSQLLTTLGAEGRNAQAYVIAHEVGHHLQNLVGTERQARRLQQQNPRAANDISVRLELQADCYAGVWARQADERGKVAITQQEYNQAIDAAAAVGDDRIQAGAGQRVDPETWTHGSARARQGWFARGFESGDPGRCDTFNSSTDDF
ncbi:MAG: neutral zinc metallopeptidase [Candidatus Nanopelagicales bacterium]